jgi:hypothetical protein
VAADNILKPPTAAPEHVDNVLKPPTKTKEEKDSEAAKRAAEEEAAAKAAAAEAAAEKAAKAKEVQGQLLDEFVSGNKVGEELKEWCAEQGAVLPPVEMLVFHLLAETEKKNPDPDCAWAEPTKYGAALLSLVEEDIYGQMQVLWGIQKYCDTLGFPKLNEEYLVQSMFRSMYKYDLTADEAFAEWKEDESDEHEQGKVNAIIQTVDWFNWLEEEEEDDDDGLEDDEDFQEEEE